MSEPIFVLNAVMQKTQQEEFAKSGDARVGKIGALLELRWANLWRVNGYSMDEWGVRIDVTHLPMPGFSPSRNAQTEISASWEILDSDPGRWQAQYCWKFLFGDELIESVIAAGAQAKARGMVLSSNKVLAIFNWRSGLEDRREKGLGHTDFSVYLDDVLSWPEPPVPPPPGA